MTGPDDCEPFHLVDVHSDCRPEATQPLRLPRRGRRYGWWVLAAVAVVMFVVGGWVGWHLAPVLAAR